MLVLTYPLLLKFIHNQNINLIVKGTNIDVLDIIEQGHTVCYNYDIQYKTIHNIYSIDLQKNIDNTKIIDLLQTICESYDYYLDDTTFKKNIILLRNTQVINKNTLDKLNSFIDRTYISSVFLLHFTSINTINSNISSRFLILKVPNLQINTEIDTITYDSIIKLIKQPITTDSITKCREICYMYYTANKESSSLQTMIIETLGANLYLPNSIKFKLIEDIAFLNKLYVYCYRKPILLESIIYSLFKNLQYYTYNI